MPYRWPQNHRLAFSLVIAIEAANDSAPDRQYGLRAGFPRIADLLIEYPVKATFLVDPDLLEREALLAEFIQQRGHEAALHAQLEGSMLERRSWLRAAIERVEAACGRRPAGFRSRGRSSSDLQQLLTEEEFRYVMDQDFDDQPFSLSDGHPLVNLPLPMDTSDQRFLDAPALTPDAWLQYAIDSFDVLYGEAENAPRMMSLLVHAHIIGRPGRINALEQMLQYASSKDDVWMATRVDIAEHFAVESLQTDQD